MVAFDPDRHHRRSIRLPAFDYASPGAYFVTVCTYGRRRLFGEVAAGEMRLNPFGLVAEECWRAIPDHFGHVALDAFVVMPNHIHGIIVLVEARHAAPRQEFFGKPVAGSISTIVRSFKSAATRCINEMQGAPGAAIWQRNYYEHIIRDETDWSRIREYIQMNPARWQEDRENPRGAMRQ